MQTAMKDNQQDSTKPPRKWRRIKRENARRRQEAMRSRDLIATYSAALGGDAVLTEAQRIDIRKAAELVVLAEDARAVALRDGPGNAATMSAMIRLSSAATRAVQALGLPAPNAAAAPSGDAWQKFLASHEGDG
jgi:hypothetical protein